MPGIHKNNTISFRPSEWERILIEEKAALSGLAKKDYIARSCIYSKVCVVGNKNNVQRIVDAVQEMQYTLKEISSRISTGDFPLSDEVFREMSMRYYAMCLSIVEILDGASYLFGKENPKSSSAMEKQERLRQLLETLDYNYQDGDKDSNGDN